MENSIGDHKNHPMAAAIPLASSAESVIDHDLLCARCQYNLRGLSSNMACPECSMPVLHSTEGNRLQFADTDWLDRLRLGVTLKLWSMLVGLLIGLAAGLAGSVAIPPILQFLLGGAGGILGLAAILLITAPEPTIGASEDPVTLRKFVRACAVAGFCGSWLTQSDQLGGSEVVTVIGYAASLFGVAAMFGEFIYLRRFARRIPDSVLEKRTAVVMWGMITVHFIAVVFGALVVFWVPGAGPVGFPGGAAGVLFAFLGCFAGLGAVVFGVLYVFLLLRYRKAFGAAAISSRRFANGIERTASAIPSGETPRLPTRGFNGE